MMVRYFGLLMLCALSRYSGAQAPVDLLISKMQDFNASSPDSSLRYCNLIIKHYQRTNQINKEAFYYNRKGVLLKRMAKYIDSEEAYENSFQLYSQAADKKGKSIALNNLGEIHLLQGEYSEAIKLHRQTLSLKQELQDTFGIGSSYLNLGNVYLYQSLYEDAIEHYMQASEMFSIISDSLRLSSVYNNLGALHNYMGNRDKTLFYWEQSLTIKKRVGNQPAIAKALNNLAEIYMSSGNLEASLEYLEESLLIKKQIKDKEGYLVTTYNLGECHRLRKEYTKAYEYFQEARGILSKMPLSLHHAELHNKMGLYHLELNQLKAAEKYFEIAKKEAEQINAKEVGLSAADNLALAYELQGNYKKAYTAKGQYVSLRDSLQRQEQQDKILELESQYEVKSKNQQIELLQSQNTIASLQKEQVSKRNRFLIGGVGALSIISLILYGNVRLRKRNSKLLAEKNLLIQEDLTNKNVLINEIHHRIKNNLSIIDSLINIQLLNDKDTEPEEMLRNAQNRIRSISRLHDLLYQNQLKQELNLKRYLSEICNHVLESYSSVASPISLNTHFDKIIVEEGHYIKLGLITNELLTNALKHGFPKGESGEINLSLISNGLKEAKLIIGHNGMQATREVVLTSKGLGMQLIKGLAKQIKGEFSISNDDPIKFTVTFPCE